MARLISARIDGLAGRKEPLNINFAQDVNVFWGLNGSGKTSLLKILHSALYNDSELLTRVPFKAAAVKFYSERWECEFTRSTKRIPKTSKAAEARRLAVRSMLDDARLTSEEAEALEQQVADADTSFAWTLEPSNPSLKRMAHRYLPTSRISEVQAGSLGGSVGVERYSSLSRVLNEATMAELLANQIQQLWNQYSRSALLEIRKAQQEGLAAILSSVLRGGGVKGGQEQPGELDVNRAYGLVRKFFEGQSIPLQLGSFELFAANYASNKLLREVVWEIYDVQQGIEQAQEPQHRIEEMLGDLFSGGKRVKLGEREVTVEVDDGVIPISLLSSGEGQLLRIFLECLAAETNIIIIDEPELSMHVDWQHRLVSSMSTINPHAQIVLATHSPEIMADLPDDRIIKL